MIHLNVGSNLASKHGSRFNNIEIAVAKGKKEYDKRHTKKTRDWNREKARYFRRGS